jgi:hypothetical protein
MAGMVSITWARRSRLSRSTASRVRSLSSSSRSRVKARPLMRSCWRRSFRRLRARVRKLVVVHGAQQEVGRPRLERLQTEAALLVDT